MSNEIVFDIETQNTFSDVNNDFSKLKISCVSIYRFSDNTYESFEEHELGKLWPILEKSDRLIGYNIEHFDLPVMNNYYPGNLLQFPYLDIMKEVKSSVGIRLKLNDIAMATLDIEKSADGLQAIRWWKEGKIDEIKKYCEQDVKATKALNNSRRTVAKLIGALPENIIFTSSGTESDNLAIYGIAKAHAQHGKHIISTPIEHHAVLHPLEDLKKWGWEITYLKVNDKGIVNVEDVIKAIRPDTILISIMYANNEIGVIEPIAE